MLIKYIKSVLWRVAKRLSYIEEARCLEVKGQFYDWTWIPGSMIVQNVAKYVPNDPASRSSAAPPTKLQMTHKQYYFLSTSKQNVNSVCPHSANVNTKLPQQTNRDAVCDMSAAARYILHEATLWFTEVAELIKKVSAQWNLSVCCCRQSSNDARQWVVTNTMQGVHLLLLQTLALCTSHTQCIGVFHVALLPSNKPTATVPFMWVSEWVSESARSIIIDSNRYHSKICGCPTERIKTENDNKLCQCVSWGHMEGEEVQFHSFSTSTGSPSGKEPPVATEQGVGRAPERDCTFWTGKQISCSCWE